MELTNMKDHVQETIEAHRNDLIFLSQLIHKNPEVAFNEKQASIWLTDYLEKNNFRIEKNVCDLSTAFKASYGEGQNVIAFLSEVPTGSDQGKQ